MDKSQLPDVAPLKSQGDNLVAQAAALVIGTNDDYKAAGEMLVAVSSLKKQIADAFENPKKKAHEAHRAITALEKQQLEAPQKAEQILKAAMGTYLRVEEARRKQQEAEAQAALKKQEEDRRLSEAQRLESAGHVAEANQVLDAPMVAPVVELEKPKAAGVSARKVWGFCITDPAKISTGFLLADVPKIRAAVSAMGPDAVKVVGGIEVYEDFNLSARPGKAAA